MKKSLLLLLLPLLLFAKKIETFYGPLEITEPVLLELIETPSFQRLRHIHQYGVAYYNGTATEPYTRYDHSLGVFAILRIKGRPLDEQIAGLLHDVSHTVFSHVGDWLFGKEYQEKDYQNGMHEDFLSRTEIGAILNRYGFEPKNLQPLEENFPALEQPLPNLCAERIDYNIQGAYHQGFLTKDEGKKLLDDLEFTNGKWIGHNNALMSKIVHFSLFMTKNHWGSANNHFASHTLADAMRRALEIGVISHKEVHFGTDDEVWDKLKKSDDPFIQKKMELLPHIDMTYLLVKDSKEADQIVRSKFRGINPWMQSENSIVRLTEIDPIVAQEFTKHKELISEGWAIKHLAPSNR